MEYRRLGRDGLQVPVLSLGAWPLGSGMGQVDEATAVDTIRAVISITLIDIAQAYRSSEATLGKALKGSYRERCFLATKVNSEYSREGILSAIDDSLRALEVDAVDLYQVHGSDALSYSGKHGDAGRAARSGQNSLPRRVEF